MYPPAHKLGGEKPSPGESLTGLHRPANDGVPVAASDSRLVLEMGRINVVSGWGVRSDERDLWNGDASHPFGSSIQASYGKISRDNAAEEVELG